MTLEETKELLREMDENLEEGSVGWDAALCLLASLEVGPFPDKVADFTELPLETVNEFAERLQANGVWKDGMIHAAWDDPEAGAIAFWCDVGVATGLIERAD